MKQMTEGQLRAAFTQMFATGVTFGLIVGKSKQDHTFEEVAALLKPEQDKFVELMVQSL